MGPFKLGVELLESLMPGKSIHVEQNGVSFCLASVGSKIYAFQGKCPHAGARLADGYIDALGNVVCPLHHYKFNLENGRNVSGEGYFLKRYTIEQREDGCYLQSP